MTMDQKFYSLQITRAAGGLVTGTLDEWPALRAALKARGYDLPLNTPAFRLRRLCAELLSLKHCAYAGTFRFGHKLSYNH